MVWCKSQYADDLKKFSDLLYKFDEYNALSNVVTAMDLESRKLCSLNSLKINMKNVECVIRTKISKTIPIDLKEINVFLDCSYDFDALKDIDVNDLINDYSLQLEMMGTDDNGNTFKNAWHLDKDIRVAGDGKQKFTHPTYHFQAGGQRMESVNTGDTLFLGAPRIPHPPMDIFLAIHFIINNFYSSKDYPFLHGIFNDGVYQEIIERAQNRMFKPYFNAFKDDNTHLDFTLKNVFPLAFNC